jgi:hypothetical protein
LPILLAGSMAAGASHLVSAVASTADSYSEGVGLVVVTGDMAHFAFDGPDLASTLTIFAVEPGNPPAMAKFRVLRRAAEEGGQLPLILRGDRALPLYELEPIETHVLQPPFQGFAFLTLPQIVEWTTDLFTADIDADGKLERFHSCTSREGVHYIVSSVEGQQLWIAYVYLGYEVEPTCDDDDSASGSDPVDDRPPESQTAGQGSIVDAIRSVFQSRNAKVELVTLLDLAPLVRPEEAGYVVLARGIRRERQYQGSLEDELFGVFIVDSSFRAVTTTLDILPTKRWNDYSLEFESVSSATVVVVGQGATYGDERLRRTYRLP